MTAAFIDLESSVFEASDAATPWLLLLVAFFTPGIIWAGVRSRLHVKHFREWNEQIVHVAAYSIVAWMFTAVFIGGLGASWTSVLTIALQSVAGIVLSITVGIVGGIASGLVEQKDIVRRVLKRFGLNAISQSQSAWDKSFGRSEPSFVCITTTSGEKIYGGFGDQSLAGATQDCRDLFLEKEMHVDANGNLCTVPMSRGVFVTSSSIVSVQFVEKCKELGQHVREDPTQADSITSAEIALKAGALSASGAESPRADRLSAFETDQHA